MRRKLPFWATFLTLIGVIILCALGTWQVKRLAWKNDIVQKLHTAYASSGNALSFNTMKENDFAYGKITGKFLFDKSIALGYRVDKDRGAGYSLVTPLQTDQGTLLVNLGFNPNTMPIKTHALNAHNAQTITLSGLARSPSWNRFTPDNDPENDTWYKYDINQIAAAKDLKEPIPFILYADKSSIDLGENLPNNERWHPKNDHAQYAFFWFALAATLIIIYLLRFIKKSA
ncbi:MAG: hypothetical protein GW778_00805 [Alphaproteobacteria bacterium]|nr:hypothetical protein [Alphaproteobacteria bacterium]